MAECRRVDGMRAVRTSRALHRGADQVATIRKGTQPSRAGMTLVELLVVIAIIALLMAMLLPAIQGARESARRTQCSNNARQIALACQTYAAQNEVFPPGGDTSPRGGYGLSWLVHILPHLEQTAVHQRLDLTGERGAGGTTGWVGNNPGNGEALRAIELPAFYCPSSDLPKLSMTWGGHSISGSMFVGIAGARDDASAREKTDPGNAPGYVSTGGVFRCDLELRQPDGSQRCTRNGAVAPAEIRDGTSNTLLVAETSAWLVNPGTGGKVDNRADCGHGFLMGNACDWHGRMFNLTVVAHRINETSALAYGAMGNCGPNQPLRSPHAGGVNAGLADGSTRFLSETIDFQLLCNLANRKDGKVIDAAGF
jgi:prepilin-type N-terminal cleavage/methylation domain-containing protein